MIKIVMKLDKIYIVIDNEKEFDEAVFEFFKMKNSSQKAIPIILNNKEKTIIGMIGWFGMNEIMIVAKDCYVMNSKGQIRFGDFMNIFTD
jgi:hypothetical protein